MNATGDIGLFVVVSEGAAAAGVRRIEAMTGEGARLWLMGKYRTLVGIEEVIGPSSDPISRAQQLRDERRKFERELAEAKNKLALGGGTQAVGTGVVAAKGTAAGHGFAHAVGQAIVAQVLDGFDPKGLRNLIDQAKATHKSAVIAFVTVVDGRGTIAVGVTDDLVGKHSAVDLVKVGVEALGGKGGGGRPDMAQGGGPDGAKAAEAIAAVRAVLAAEQVT